MQDKVILNEKDARFYAVDWGRTKGLVAKESAAFSDKVQVRITEYLPGYVHKLHVHPTYNPNSEVMRAIIIKSPPDSK